LYGYDRLVRWVLIVIRLGMAAMFAAAAFGKIADPSGTRQAVKDFAVPARLIRPIAAVLPVGELVLAGGLVLDRTSRFAAAGAAALLAIFAGAVARLIRRGLRVECRCFGSLRSSVAGPRTIMRNGLAAAMAVYVSLCPMAHLTSSSADARLPAGASRTPISLTPPPHIRHSGGPGEARNTSPK
jgi:Methylamine utilisation protein MauE